MILVVGATGRLGRIITLRLLAEGRPVRILVPPDAYDPALVEDGAQPVFGDLNDQSALEAACQRVDTLISTAGSMLPGDLDAAHLLDMRGQRSLAAAAKAGGVKQFILVSMASANATANARAKAKANASSPLPFMSAHGAAEQVARDSGIPYTIVAPGPFTEDWVGMLVATPIRQGLPVTITGPARQSFLSISDAANFIIATIGHPAAMNQRLVLGGPEAISFEEAAGVFGRLLGRPVQVVQAHADEALPCVPREALPWIVFLSTEDWILSGEHLAHAFHTELTPFETTARAMLLGMHVGVR